MHFLLPVDASYLMLTSDQRFQRTMVTMAEAVQIFAPGTLDFAESIKQIWGPQTEQDTVETSNPLPVDGIQDVQIDQLRERTPVSQDGDQLDIHSRSQTPFMTFEDAYLEPLHSAIGPLQTANLQLSNEMDTLAASTKQPAQNEYIRILMSSGLMQREQDDCGATEDRESSPLSVSSSSSVSSSEEEEEGKVAQIKVKLNRREISPIKVSYQVHKKTHKEVIHLEEENERSSTLTQEQSSDVSSSEEDNNDYSSSSSEAASMQIPAAREVPEEHRNMYPKAAIQPQENSEASSSASEDEYSE
ncbi:hypothetical protein N7463_010670 [Penicillium fimorum]|uniref:Uncharacterized protein n=1 Tax=Penicillium fimorum TaxID=1882269 RepID=A0A9W9XKC7_9EURO|nr:hypothetical protein N7463_010670 [Penicillium fimorum]